MFENLSDVEERDEASPEVKEEIQVRQITQGSTALQSKTTSLEDSGFWTHAKVLSPVLVLADIIAGF